MNENPEGTPNPLNPAPDTGEELAAGTGPLEFVETANVSEIMEEPEPAPEPEKAPESENAPELVKPASFTEAAGVVAVEETEPVGPTKPVAPVEPTEPAEPIEPVETTESTSHEMADPVMRPVSHNNFDTLSMEDTADNESPVVEEVTLTEAITTSPAPMNDALELVAKDSIVEPTGSDSKKRILTIGAIVLLMIAIICGAAAAAIMLVGKSNDDRVDKAIMRLLNGETSSIITVNGTVNALPSTDDSELGDFSLDFNGTFDMKSGMNTVSAKINTELANGNRISIGVDELQNEDQEVFIKVRGLDSLYEENSDSSGLADVANNQWFLISDDFGDTMADLGLFDNSSACLTNALLTLPNYSKDLAKKYEVNPFITYSTDKLEISKKKNELFKIGFDDNKLTAFINSLSNNGFINELNACVGNTATNDDVNANMIAGIFVNFPTIYVEVDDEYNFTRVYFKAATNGGDVVEDCQCVTAPCDCGGVGVSPMTITADLSLTYPNKLEITEPDDYLDMSVFVNQLLTNTFSVKTN